MGWAEEVDRWFAAAFGQPTADRLWDGAQVVVGPYRGPMLGWPNLIAFRRHDCVRVVAPPALVADLEHLATYSPHDAFVGATYESALGDRVRDVVGPNWHGFTDALDVEVPGDIRRLGPDDLPALRGLLAAAGDQDWGEAGFPRDPDLDERASFGRFRNKTLVAASNTTPFGEAFNNVGVLTHPEHRGYGHGHAVAAAAVRWALTQTSVVQWRARATNLASIAIARRLGCRHHLDNLLVRLRDLPTTAP